jgi:hypothetical protein
VILRGLNEFRVLEISAGALSMIFFHFLHTCGITCIIWSGDKVENIIHKSSVGMSILGGDVKCMRVCSWWLFIGIKW